MPDAAELEHLRMAIDYVATMTSRDQLAQVVAGLSRCHDHHFAVYADELTIIGSRQLVMQCVPPLVLEYGLEKEPVE